jgi:6-pyruvoyltetrahydropterin/6-carboxytetrahydropterin synthase
MILDEFDHTNISNHPAFKELNPTSEIIAKTIYNMLSPKMNDGNVKLHRIRVCESPTSGATYFED